jgi:hypothetical protein
MKPTLKSIWLAAVALPLLASCGLAETAATGAVAAQEVQQAQQAKATEERYRQQLEAAQRSSQEHRDAALKEADQ